MRRFNLQTLLLATSVIGALALGVYVFMLDSNGHAQPARRGELRLGDIPVNGERAYGYLKDICKLGTRISGSDGMTRQQELLTAHFKKHGAAVTRQEFRARHPQTGDDVVMANLIISWHPEAAERVLLCAHYDTRPLPDNDPDPRERTRGVFIGANDGASGPALMMELAHHMTDVKASTFGIDFILFDGEELVYDGQRDPYFLGSKYFSEQYVSHPPKHKYRWGVLVDMVGDASLELFQEQNSVTWRDTKPLVNQVWGIARQLGVKEFIPRPRHDVRDDHLMLHDIAKIPTIDVIDFDYPRPGARSYWHTTRDVPENCSALSLAKVGWVMLEWLKQVQLKQPK